MLDPNRFESTHPEQYQLGLKLVELPNPEKFSPESLLAIKDLDHYFQALSLVSLMADGLIDRNLLEASSEELKRVLPLVNRGFGFFQELRAQTDRLGGIFPFRKIQVPVSENREAQQKIEAWVKQLNPNIENQAPFVSIPDQEALDLVLMKTGLAVDHDLKNKASVLSALQLVSRRFERGIGNEEENRSYLKEDVVDRALELKEYLSDKVLRFLREKEHRDEVPDTTNRVRQQTYRHLRVSDYVANVDVKVNLGEIPDDLKDRKIDLPDFLVESVVINLASNAGKAALLRQDAENPSLMEPGRAPLPKVEPKLEVEFLPRNQTEYLIPPDKMGLLAPDKDYMFVVVKDNFIGYPTHFIAHGFTGISEFEKNEITRVTAAGVSSGLGMVGMEKFMKPYGGAFILQNRADTLGAITIWAVPLIT